MRRSLALAARARGHTSPNPMVGAVVVRDGEMIGEGYHSAAGHPHAEIEALHRAGRRALGATLYVTLEPCAHHGRTPPCIDAIRAAGIARVVAAMGDPDPRVDGRGFAALRASGIAVTEGVLEPLAARLNEGFVTRVRYRRPFITVKLATTVDGRVAVSGRRYLTGANSLRWVHRLRADVDAVLVGSGTILADDPQLTVREVRGRDPLRVVVDTHARTSAASRVATHPEPERTVLMIGAGTDSARADALRAGGVTVVAVVEKDGRIDLAAAVALLAQRGVNSVLCEGGPTLATELLRQQLVDRLVLLMSPLIGGDGPRAFGDLVDVAAIGDISVRRLHPDVALIANFASPSD